MSARRRILPGILLGAILLAGAWWVIQPGSPPGTAERDYTPVAQATAQRPPAPVAPLAAPTSPTATSTPAQSLEPPYPTLASDLRELEPRLAQGDLAAGWEAERKLRECSYRTTMEASAKSQSWVNDLVWYPEEVLPPMESWQTAETRQYCAGSEATAARRAFDLLLRMAEMGDLRAQLKFTLDPPIFRRQALAELDLILVYRERAPALLERALNAGSQRALMALLDAHTPALQTVEEDAGMIDFRSYARLPAASGASDHLSRIRVVRTYRELPHRQILTPDPATAYRLALVCQRVCMDPAWLDRANRTVAAIEATLDTATRLRQFEAAQALLLGAFAHPVEDPPVTPGYWWNAR